VTSHNSAGDLDEAYLGTDYQLRFLNPRPREVCRALGLNWLAALRLRDGGWLSFDPETAAQLSEPEEIELRFVGSLVVRGCDEQQLEMLLQGLRKPYRYRLERVYFDWLAGEWRLLPDSRAFGDIEDLIDTLQQDGDIAELRSLRDRITVALEELEALEEEEGNQ